MEKRCCDALRRLARQAKNRLGNRNYFEGKGNNKVLNGGYLADYKLVHLSNKKEEKFYEQVREILENEIDAIKPIGKLADKTKFEQMSETQKERYIINLADKYLKMKERFERERASTMEFAG
ncbi:MAG: hypothetical protein PHS54_04790 [Clostridia bacterium]|nr:hypothetical protein [Clostridia bacterium]